jgi:cytochrome c peroxidase
MGGWAAPPVAGTPGMGAPPDMPPPLVQLSEAEVALIGTLSPLPPLPPDETNAVADDPLAAELGRALFEDPEFSGPLRVASELGAVGDTGQVSCGTCHFGPALDDFAQVSTGTGSGTRNSLSLVNSAYQRWTNWGGRFSAQWELSVAVIENPNVMNGTRLRVAHRIADAHRTGYEAVFGPIAPELADAQRFPADGKPKPAPTAEVPAPPDGPWEAMTDVDRTVVNTLLVNYGKAIAAFLRTIVSRDSPFDRFVAGDRGALDPFAQAGLRLFVGKARCITCHNGPLFSDEAFHNIGVPTMGAADDGRWKDIPPLLASAMSSATPWSDAPDSGRLAGLTNPPPEETRGQFRTPSLRGVAQSAPYMHNGWFSDLRSVVDHYDWGGGMPASGQLDRQLVPLHLTDQEKEQLVAFLHSLTGEPVDPMLAVGVRPTW